MNIPALRQSHTQMMACPAYYKAVVIDGKRVPDSPFSDRGNEIHFVMSAYVNHCTRREVAADWAEFDRLTEAAGPEAGPMLDALRDNFVVNFREVYGTEEKLAVTDEFNPIDGFEDAPGTYEGTLDLIEVSDDLTHITIRDFKSHFRPFDPDTYQSQSYPVLAFAHFPKAQSVTFELIFVRFANARRPVTYTRDQLPVLQTEMRRRRAQQIAIHQDVEAGVPVKALPGDHCVYCPHNKTNTCPVAELNGMVNKTPEERLIFLAWLDKAREENMAQLKAYVDAEGPVSYRDANGVEYSYANAPSESSVYPAVDTIRTLIEWSEKTSDPTLFNGLRISGLGPKLKAKKRTELWQQLQDGVAQTETRVRMQLKKNGATVAVEEGE